jgi:hypothetical protein
MDFRLGAADRDLAIPGFSSQVVFVGYFEALPEWGVVRPLPGAIPRNDTLFSYSQNCCLPTSGEADRYGNFTKANSGGVMK